MWNGRASVETRNRDPLKSKIKIPLILVGFVRDFYADDGATGLNSVPVLS